jgi:hypothetical protein
MKRYKMNLVLLLVFVGLMYYLSQNKQFMKRILSVQPVTIMLLIGVFILVCRLMKWENFTIDADDDWCGDTTNIANVTHLRKKEDNECPSGLWDRLFLAPSADQSLGAPITKKCSDIDGLGKAFEACTDGTTLREDLNIECAGDPCVSSDCCD